MSEKKYRLVTRGDFDGVVCGTLLKELEMIDDTLFVEPADMQAGRVEVGPNDIISNLPYMENVYMCFNHHISEVERIGERNNLVIDADAPSAARVIYNHFGGKQGFPDISEELMDAVDQADSAQYSEEDILAPSDWTLLNFLVDPATGLDRAKAFSITNEQFIEDLMTYCRHNPIEEILQLPDVLERFEIYTYDSEFAERQYKRCSRIEGKVVVSDMRDEEELVPVNRFLVYALYPDCNTSIRIEKTRDGRVRIAAGRSILDRSANANIGSLMLAHGGGGLAAAGACRVEADKVDDVVSALVRDINAAG
ncbi:MAG: exopolyphosphatase [Rhodospirillaceae bacterium]|nr:exopolyphosphatase [Rhodospirillaceae bacterium]